MNTSIGPGLRQKISTASSEQDVTNYLTEGLKFQFADKKTKRAWKSTARKRLNVLKGTNVEAPKIVENNEETVSEFVSDKKKNKSKGKKKISPSS